MGQGWGLTVVVSGRGGRSDENLETFELAGKATGRRVRSCCGRG